MSHTIALQLAGIVILAIAAQWIAWRLHLPSIVVLLAAGLVIGPGLRLLQPDALFGHLLLPLVSLGVGIILYEGGLNLQFRELRKQEVAGILFRIVTGGALLSWALGAIAAGYLLGFDWPVAALLGAILIVTGPTVIGPILRHLRLRGRLGAILRWEGIVLDLLGAILSVLVFTVLHAGEFRVGLANAAKDLLTAVIAGIGCGGAAAVLLGLGLWRFWMPDSLHIPISLMLMLAAFTGANLLQEEAGLVAATVMGMALSNQPWVPIRHLVEFKETLTILVISVLFVTLGARLEPKDLQSLGWQSLGFVGAMILVVRPISIFAATLGTSLPWRERIFLACMAPRGIVAAAVASVMALALVEMGYPHGKQLVPITFLMVFASVSVYGFLAGPLARWLGLVQPHPQGILFVGAHSWARAMAQALKRLGCPVMLVDTDWDHIRACRMEDLPSIYGSALAERTIEEIDFSGLGRLLALTANNEVNTLACMRFREFFGRKEVYQLVFPVEKRGRLEVASHEHHGRFLFGQEWNFSSLNHLLDPDPKIRSTTLTQEFDFRAFMARHGPEAVLLFIRDAKGSIYVCTTEGRPEPLVGDTLVWFSRQSNQPIFAHGNVQSSDKQLQSTNTQHGT